MYVVCYATETKIYCNSINKVHGPRNYSIGSYQENVYTHTCITLLCVTACYCGRFSGIIISNWVDRFASMSSSSHIRASVLPLSLSWAQEKGRRSRACQVSIAIVRSPTLPHTTPNLSQKPSILYEQLPIRQSVL